MPIIELPRSLPNADHCRFSLFYCCLDPALIGIGQWAVQFLTCTRTRHIKQCFYAGHWSCKLIKLKYDALIDVRSWKEQNFNLPETDKFCWHAQTGCYTLNLNSLYCKWRRNLQQLACISRLSGVVHVKQLSMEMYKCCFSPKLLTLIAISVTHSHIFSPIHHGITSVTSCQVSVRRWTI